MGTGHGLQVVLGVVVAVKDDNGVGCLEVDTETARTGGEEEGKVRRPRRVEVLDTLLADITGYGAVKTLVDVTARGHVVGDDIEQAYHLAEDEDTVVVRLETCEELVEKNHLARVHDEAAQLLVDGLCAVLSSVKQVGMVGRLLELHGDVHERHALGATLAEYGKVLGQDVCPSAASKEVTYSCSNAAGDPTSPHARLTLTWWAAL